MFCQKTVTAAAGLLEMLSECGTSSSVCRVICNSGTVEAAPLRLAPATAPSQSLSRRPWLKIREMLVHIVLSSFTLWQML